MKKVKTLNELIEEYENSNTWNNIQAYYYPEYNANKQYRVYNDGFIEFLVDKINLIK